MITLDTHAAVASALENPNILPELKALIRLRIRQLCQGPGRCLGSEFLMFVVEGGDSPEVINAALGFAITGPEAEPASHQWIFDHGLWFEIVYDDPGRRLRVFVENTPATELGLHYLCLSHFWRDEA